MRVAVFNRHIGLAGGGELVALSITRALEESGRIVDLVTYRFEPGDAERAIELLTPGYRPRSLVVHDEPILIKLLGASGRFVRLRKPLLINEFFKRYGDRYDLVIDTSSNAPTRADVVYVHYPAVLRTSGKSGLHWALYDKLVQHASRKLLGRPKLILCNSSWTAEKFRSTYGDDFKVEVLHPPVDVEYFSAVAGMDKERLVVTVSRFAPVKNLEKVVDAAYRLRDFRFVIAGSRGKYSDPVVNRIERRLRELGVDNVELLFNVPRDKLRELLGRAKYYLHPPFAEHFGIAVAEAMSAGCVPIVYRDGGAWCDVVSRVSYTLGYHDVSEVPHIIKAIEGDEKLYEELRKRSIEVLSSFAYSKFKEKLLAYLGGILQ